MTQSYKEYREWGACYDCGAKPGRKNYETYLRMEIDRLQHIADMTPEEFDEWHAKKGESAFFVEWVSGVLLGPCGRRGHRLRGETHTFSFPAYSDEDQPDEQTD